jgi:Ca-activated chloride channel homolog
VRRRALLLALAAALVAAAPAAAQEPEPVVGGGSFLTAPLLESGSYTDTLLPAERLYYGVELEAGQRLRIACELDVDDSKYNDFAAGFSVGVQTPLREVDVLDAVDEDITGNTSVAVDFDERIEFVTAPVLTRSAALGDSGVFRGPGTWYVSLFLPTTDERPRRVEFPARFEIEVMGEPQADPERDPTPAATPAPAEPEDGSREDGGTSLGAVLGLGAAGVVVGLAGGAVAGRRRRF